MLPVRGALLGKGSFGVVYHATDPVHGKVAMKVLRQRADETAADWQLRKADLLQEGQRLSEATHPNVVKVFSIHDVGDEIMLVLEFCSGGALENAYKAGPLGPNMVKAHMTDVALGLGALHARGMLHRDIKPANILLDGAGRARLGDFGLVTNNIVLGYASANGYHDHLAIEIHQGKGTSTKTDIWALGMTTYRLLHGHHWYQGGPLPRALVPSGRFASKLPWLPHVPKTWRKLIRKAMHDDASKRFQTTQHVLDAFADLPVLPDWTVVLDDIKVKWTCLRKDRRVEVYLDRASGRWKATSHPLEKGKARTLATGDKLSELEVFFEQFR